MTRNIKENRFILGILFAFVFVILLSSVSSQGFIPPETPIFNYYSTNGTSGGNPFDQDLNSTDNVQFANITSTRYFIGDGSYLTGIEGSKFNLNSNTLTPKNSAYNLKIGYFDFTTTETLDINGTINVNEGGYYNYDGNNFLHLSKIGAGVYGGTHLGVLSGSGNESQTSIGYFAGRSNTGNFQTAIGYGAGSSNTRDSQTAIGYSAGQSNTGLYQTAVGYQAGQSNTGLYQTAVGYRAGYQNSGGYQTAIGYYAGNGNNQIDTTFVGESAGQTNRGSSSTGVGVDSLKSNQATGSTAIGKQSGYVNSGSNSVFVGVESGYQNTGLSSSFLGYRSGDENDGDYSIGIGYEAFRFNTGDKSIAIGYGAGSPNSGHNLVAIGYYAGSGNNLDNQFILKHASVNSIPLIQGNFSSGNVGIGTTTPSQKLHVEGNANVTGTIYYGSLQANSPILYYTDDDFTVEIKKATNGNYYIEFVNEYLETQREWVNCNTSTTWYQIETCEKLMTTAYRKELELNNENIYLSGSIENVTYYENQTETYEVCEENLIEDISEEDVYDSYGNFLETIIIPATFETVCWNETRVIQNPYEVEEMVTVEKTLTPYEYVFDWVSKTAKTIIELFYENIEEWDSGENYQVGDLVKYGDIAYEVIQPHTSQSSWTPNVAHSLFSIKFFLEDNGEIIEQWVQPVGASDCYSVGEQVSYNGDIWENNVNCNVWTPGVHGWSLI